MVGSTVDEEVLHYEFGSDDHYNGFYAEMHFGTSKRKVQCSFDNAFDETLVRVHKDGNDDAYRYTLSSDFKWHDEDSNSSDGDGDHVPALTKTVTMQDQEDSYGTTINISAYQAEDEICFNQNNAQTPCINSGFKFLGYFSTASTADYESVFGMQFGTNSSRPLFTQALASASVIDE